MRPWLVVFLWALLLLQPGWAALGAPDGGAGGPAGAHHCPHAHIPCDAQSTAAAADADHADCGTCHGSCNLAVFGLGALGVITPLTFSWPGSPPPPASHPADLPERPQWAALASA